VSMPNDKQRFRLTKSWGKLFRYALPGASLAREEAIGITWPSPARAAEAEPAPAQPAGPPLVLREGSTEPPAIESLRLDST
jgi:hypothetical protein